MHLIKKGLTIKQTAKQANTSTATVNRILRHYKKIFKGKINLQFTQQNHQLINQN